MKRRLSWDGELVLGVEVSTSAEEEGGDASATEAGSSCHGPSEAPAQATLEVALRGTCNWWPVAIVRKVSAPGAAAGGPD